MPTDSDTPKRFAVALSFPGEHRDYVVKVADRLSSIFGKNRVLYDEYHAGEFARPNLNVYLPTLYRKASELIVLFLCPEYKEKQFCKLEWRHIANLLASADEERIMLLRHGYDGDFEELGILPGDGTIDFAKRSNVEIADLIVQRFQSNGGKIPTPPKPDDDKSAKLPPIDIARIDKYAPEELIGREAETAIIEEAWGKAVRGEAHPHVRTFVALGGGGKTSLVANWAIAQTTRPKPDFDAAFAWSFYNQGTSEQAGASSELFLTDALKFFGAEAIQGEIGLDKGKRLAKIVGGQRALLILDGLEPLQYPPTSPLRGQLKDDGVLALLKGLAQRNAGLCLVTTRYDIENIKAYAATAPQRDLAPLSNESGGRLLEKLGVNGTRAEREKLSEDVMGHALTLNLIGSYLHKAFKGDIRKVDLIDLGKADAKVKQGHAFRVMDAYVKWFESDEEEGARALAILRSLGLFDRPAGAGCLRALWSSPAIEGLTEALVGISDEDRDFLLSQLAEAKLITVGNDPNDRLVSVDAHPLLRDYFAKRLRETSPESWKDAHRRLYQHLTAATKDKEAPTLDDLQPLFEAVAHGCRAGLQQEACDEVYFNRISRGDEAYVVKKLGAHGADLGAVACFFDAPWRQVSPGLRPADQAWLLNQAAFRLRALGRLPEALEPMRAALDIYVAQEFWKAAAIIAGNLSELELTLGEVEAAARDAATAVAHAENSSDASQRISKRTTQADALHQAGRWAEAEPLFAEAEAMQAERQPKYPRLYSLRGFQYCDLLLGVAERTVWRLLVPSVTFGLCSQGAARKESASGSDAGETASNVSALLAACDAVSERAEVVLPIAERNRWLLDIGSDHITLARAALYAALMRGDKPPAEHVNAAVDFLRRAGHQEQIPRALLTYALWRAITDDFVGAREDLDEAFEIAERGPMRLHLADVHLHRARLFGLLANRPAVYPWQSPEVDLAQARALIERCGYGRRREELQDAEAALRALKKA